ncbi:MAG: SUMF1/EgtB/PvdO family nonheme iron enzyme [Akkermansiaceae bacterium]|nr:SUMF1/EgtB/PvdO family nonheme iron enzyme [Akkermansiaceae bacterium]
MKNKQLSMMIGLWAVVLASTSTASIVNRASPLWYATEPMKVKGFSDVLFPELGVDLDAKNDKGQPLWTKHRDWADGGGVGIPSVEFTSTYIYRIISSRLATSAAAHFTYDDGIEVWLNGKKIASKPSGGATDVVFDIQPGENRLLVKLFNLTAGSGLSFKFTDAPTLPASMNPEALRLAIEDLGRSFPGQYTRGAEFLKRLEPLEEKPDEGAFRALQREALLANPLLDFEKLLLVKRGAAQLGLPQNWQVNSSTGRYGYDNEIAVLSPVGPTGKLTTLFKPEGGKFVGDVDLHFDADKMLFSSVTKDNNHWQVYEIDAAGKNLRQVTPDTTTHDNFDACYLPDGRIDFVSTACFHGVPCVGGGDPVGNLYQLGTDGKTVRRLTFDQDQNWCPTVLNSGQIMYTRWEYSDSAHYHSRLVFRMNPDGTDQKAYIHSNSYWPNSTFYARPIPGSPTKFVAVISGHHGVPRMGELVLFDAARGRTEAQPAIQRIPGYDKPVLPTISDGLVDGSWPKFLHPYPLNDKYFLVSAKPKDNADWGLYLVDVFDNMVLLAEQPGYALLEPVPFRKTPKPPVIPDKVNLASKDATLVLADVYTGPGLAGVPRGTVKNLRLYEIHYAYNGMGGHINIGIDGPWDVHRILGTVPVNPDGSAMFKVPANTPIAIQPLDAEGRALQVMRSWYTAMPGEKLTCMGCHEEQNSAPVLAKAMDTTKAAAEITPWYGPARGLSFPRDVQPVLDKFCVGCHDGTQQPQGKPLLDFRAKKERGWQNFDQSYIALHPYVRRPGPESDIHLQFPLEWHASTSELIQMLQKGHHNVKLDAEAWDRLYTWIDLNVPDHGTWAEHRGGDLSEIRKLRLDMNIQTTNCGVDPEIIADLATEPVAFVKPPPEAPVPPQDIKADGWPFDAAEAKRRQTDAGSPPEMKIDFGGGQTLELVLIPAGEFIMGDLAGYPDERPLSKVRIKKPLYMAKFATTNDQFALYDSRHDSGYISYFNKDHTGPGIPLNGSRQPVVRVSWDMALGYCAWLSQKTGLKFSLPTEAQWEYACRAGTTTPLNYGAVDADFGKFANLADGRLLELCQRDSPKWIPAITNVNDGATVTSEVGRYQPNAWGLADMHGNAAQWTLTTYQPYPYKDDQTGNGLSKGMKVARGGSFYDRPARARSAFRLAYPNWQRVYNVGFRVVCEAGDVKDAVISVASAK